MARNHHGVIWTRLSGEPEKMGDLVMSDTEAAFTYTDDYLATEQPGLSLLADGRIWGKDSVTYPVSERIPVFPRLLSLIPGNNPRNLQRPHYLALLQQTLGYEPPQGMETEWRLLVMGGHGGIGHVDVFADDLAAAIWYKSAEVEHLPTELHGTEGRSELWRMLKNNVLDESIDYDQQVVEAALGPTPTVGGMIPKLLVSLTALGIKGGIYPPDTPGMRNVILKIEPPEYRGLLDLEELCLDIHDKAGVGFDVPSRHRHDEGDLHFLAVDRFDREAGLPIPMESLFSVIASGNHEFRETGDIFLDELGGVFDQLQSFTRLPGDTAEQFYRRVLMALLTGNGDLHLDNIAILGGIDDCRLSPIYDPAPMRAWPRHNLVSTIPFDAGAYTDHGEYFVQLGRLLGLSNTQTSQCIDDALSATDKYIDRLMGLDRVPMVQRTNLERVVVNERMQLMRAAVNN